jgi:hypothetical protein
VPRPHGRSAGADRRGTIAVGVAAAVVILGAGILTAAAVAFTWGWDLVVLFSDDPATAPRRVAGGTSFVTLIVGLILLRSRASLAGECLDHRRPGARNGRLLLSSAAILVATGLVGLASAVAAW